MENASSSNYLDLDQQEVLRGFGAVLLYKNEKFGFYLKQRSFLLKQLCQIC